MTKIALAKYTGGPGFVVCKVYTEGGVDKWVSNAGAEPQGLCKIITNAIALPTLAGYFGLCPKEYQTWPEAQREAMVIEYLTGKVGTVLPYDPGYFGNANRKPSKSSKWKDEDEDGPEGVEGSDGIVWQNK